MISLKTLLHSLSIWIVVIPFLIGIMNFKGLNRDSRWIFVLVCVALVPQLLTAFVKNDGPLFNVVYNLYTPVEFTVLFMLFISKFLPSFNKFIVLLSAFVYLLAFSYFFVRFGLGSKFLGGLVCINNVLYMLWILLLLKQEYSQDELLIRQENPFAWYFVAFVFYAPCTVVTFALYHYIREPSNAVLKNLSIIQDIFNILQYLFFSVGLSMRKYDKKSVS